MSRGMSKCRQGICWTGDSVMSRSVGCLVWSLKMVWHALHSAIKTTHIRRRKVVLVFEDDGHAVFSMNYVEAAQVFKLNQQRKVFQFSKKSYLVWQSQNGLAQLFDSFSVDDVTKTIFGWINVRTFDDKRWWENEASDLRVEFKSKIEPSKLIAF